MKSRRLLAVDIGNSATKIGWFDAGYTKELGTLPRTAGSIKFKTGELPTQQAIESLPVEPCQWRIVSVHREGTRNLTQWIETNRPHDEVRLVGRQELPIEVHVDFPDRVGLDRLAAAVAANIIRTVGNPAIVIGAGSAITVNLISASGAFEGGVILPGFRMSAEALYGADLLPLALLEPNNEPPPLVGKNTEDAIRSGLFWGAVGAVREVVTRMSEPMPDNPDIFVTGGDLRQFTQHLGDKAVFVPDMVLSGIAIAAM